MSSLEEAKARLLKELYKSGPKLSKAERKAKMAGQPLADEEDFEHEMRDIYADPDKAGMEAYLDDVLDAEEMIAENPARQRKEAKKKNKQLLDSLKDSKHSKDTMSIIKHLEQNVPEEMKEDPKEKEVDFEDNPDDHPILKKKKKTKIY